MDYDIDNIIMFSLKFHYGKVQVLPTSHLPTDQHKIYDTAACAKAIIKYTRRINIIVWMNGFVVLSRFT